MSLCSTRVDTLRLWAAACLLIISAGCGSSSTSTAPSAVTVAPTPTSHGSISFKIDGAPLAATGVTATFANGILAGGGGDSSRNTVLAVKDGYVNVQSASATGWVKATLVSKR
jgi:hypothetical protein